MHVRMHGLILRKKLKKKHKSYENKKFNTWPWNVMP